MTRTKDATRQYEVLEAIRKYKSEYGFSPSIRDLMELTGITSTSVVHYYIRLLEDEKLIRRTPGVSRSLDVTGNHFGHESARSAYLTYRSLKMSRNYLTAYRMRMRLS